MNTVSDAPGFGQFVGRQAAAGRLVVQPRMGFSAADRRREGLLAVRERPAEPYADQPFDANVKK